MTSLSQELTIEGSMNCSEDDSDECDSEDSTESGIDHLASMRSNQSQDKDDEDEELEYFGATGRKALLFPKKTATIPTIPDPTDFGENHTAIVKVMPSNRDASLASTEASTETEKHSAMLPPFEQLSSNDNNLYRPHEQQQQQQQQVKEEDDEFNVDIDVEKMTDNNKAAIHQALQSAAKRRVEFLPFDDNKVSLPIAEDQAGDTDFDHNIPLDFATNSTARLVMSPESITLNDLFLPPTPTYSSTYTPGSASLNRLANSVNNKTKDTSLGNRSGYLEEARKAYEDIVTGVYGMGLGDQDVLLLDDSNESRSNSYKSPNSTAVGGGHSTLGISALKMSRLTTADVIVEGDEEEAEKEDQLQEALTTGAPTNELADEWDSLPASAELSPQPHSHSFSHSAHSSSRSMTPHGATRIRSAALSRMPPSYFTTEMPNAHTLLYNAAFQYLCSQDLSQYSALISVREESPAKTSSWFGLTHKPLTFINASLHLEIPFLIAQLDYDPGETDHLHMLRCLYTFFTNLSCKASDLAPSNDSTVWNMNSLSSTGGHWETIGFQGLDPRTDLNRSMKMLSVLQMVHLIELDPSFARSLFALANDTSLLPVTGNSRAKQQDRTWPLMCVGILFTKESIVALRSGALNGEINKGKAVMPVLHCFHHACFLEFSRLLQKSSNVHHAHHLADIRKACASNPLKLYQNYTKKPSDNSIRVPSPARLPAETISESGPEGATSAGNAEADDEDVVFDDLGGMIDSDEAANNSISGRKSIFSSLFGSKKASKFEVK